MVRKPGQFDKGSFQKAMSESRITRTLCRMMTGGIPCFPALYGMSYIRVYIAPLLEFARLRAALMTVGQHWLILTQDYPHRLPRVRSGAS